MQEHIVPVFFLKRWCSEKDNKLQCFYWDNWKNKLMSERKGPASVARVKNLTVLKGVSKEKRYSIEKDFSSK